MSSLDVADQEVLLVDDDPGSVWVLGRILMHAGFSVTTSLEPTEALRLLDERRFDWVITDVSMPRVTGLELLDHVRTTSPETRIIVVTGLGTPALRDVARRRGAYLYLEKPIDPKLLIDAISDPTESGGFVGVVDDINLFDYLQMMMSIRKRVVVHVESGDGISATIYLDAGKVMHAECGALRGKAALWRCLSFEGGRFSSEPWQEPAEVSIGTAGEALLMEAATAQDEAARGTELQGAVT